MPTAWAVSTAVSPGAAIAAGRGLSSASAPPASSGSSRKGMAFAIDRMMRPQWVVVIPGRCAAPSPNSRDSGCDADASPRNDIAALRRHRLVEVVRDLVEEAGGRQPALVGADEEREVLGHVAFLDGGDADLLERACELRQRLVVVELGAMAEATGPGEDRGDGVGRGLLALLLLAEVTGHGAVGGFRFHGLAVRGHQDGGHQAERAVALRHGVGLHVAVVVLAGPDIAARPLQRCCDHVVDQAMFVGETLGVEFLLELALVHVL